ncbi:MAG: hypothetical protein II208_02220 [Alphaproteobacteria bacterium]|nr:hypothetical protein [Alphaproteobacteria bacterium]
MLKRFLTFLFCIFLPLSGMAVGLATENDPTPDAGSLITYEEIQEERKPDDTKCATKVMADALANSADTVNEYDDEQIIQQWIITTFAKKEVLTAVLACPEIKNTPEDETIKFLPIIYTFPGGREIVVNYETQPMVFKQRLQLAGKRGLPSDPNPRIGVGADVWTNTDPAWYGIIVAEHGSLDEFVGPDKNNTISLKYIYDNIDNLYPSGFNCTSKSALALDSDTINKAVTKTVGMKEQTGESDSNDYYVAGDINLGWIMWAEIALDIAITIVTFGGYAAVAGATKAARASKAVKNLTTSMKTLRKVDTVKDWAATTHKAAKITNQINKLDKVKDAAKIADLTKDLNKLKDTAKALEKIDDVKKYKEQAETLKKLSAYRNSLRLFRNAKRGNTLVRAARATKSSFSGGKLLKKAAKLGRSSSISGRVRDWLFTSTMRNVGAVAKVAASTGLLYTGLKIAGDMYDYTETSTGDYTSGVDFSPFLLLSADDIQGQENVINYGMWLMWAGDSVSAADDDAAFLQAMDFASKFHEELMEEQNDTNSPCNVDIFVVRPIMRNPGTPDSGLYYLVMNDTPWTTNE